MKIIREGLRRKETQLGSGSKNRGENLEKRGRDNDLIGLNL
jgi:hypothetical protein